MARARFNLSLVDLSELSMSSVLHSGFEPKLKREWLGPTYERVGMAGNDVNYSNVPDLRIAHRALCMEEELRLIDLAVTGHVQVQRKNTSSLLREPSLETVMHRFAVQHGGPRSRVVIEGPRASGGGRWLVCSRARHCRSNGMRQDSGHGSAAPQVLEAACAHLQGAIVWVACSLDERAVRSGSRRAPSVFARPAGTT